MCKDEELAIISLQEQKETFKSAYREDWQDPYVAWLQRRISEKVSDALDFINCLATSSTILEDQDTLEDIHGRRRIIAGYFQEAELCRYDEGIYDQVAEDKVYILKGAWCVH